MTPSSTGIQSSHERLRGRRSTILASAASADDVSRRDRPLTGPSSTGAVNVEDDRGHQSGGRRRRHYHV